MGGLDIHRKQLTFDYLDTATGEVKRGQVVAMQVSGRCMRMLMHSLAYSIEA
jgi:hypothetical protein